MKPFVVLSFLLFSIGAQAQMTPATPATKKVTPADTIRSTYIRHSVIATLSVGLIDANRERYTVPAGFEKNNVTGFAPIYARIEYGTGKNISLGLTLGHDGFYGNYYQLYQTATGSEYKRYKTDKVDIYSGGLAAYYHFTNVIPSKRLDVFAGIGLLLNNEVHSALPQGDSTIKITYRNVYPVLKAGVRYYIANRSSLYGDVGYDRQAIINVGYSCRFMKK